MSAALRRWSHHPGSAVERAHSISVDDVLVTQAWMLNELALSVHHRISIDRLVWMFLVDVISRCANHVDPSGRHGRRRRR